MYHEKLQSYHHQIDARKKAKRKRAFAYLMEMGTGKSKVDWDETLELWLDGEIDCAVIVAPKGVYLNWTQIEIPTHTPEAFRDRLDVVAWQAGATAQCNLERLLKPSERLRVLVINVEAYSSAKRAFDYTLDFMKSARIGVKMSIDESPTIKNPSSDRTQAILELKVYARYRRILTGNVAPNSPMDVYAQFAFLDERILGFSSFYSFRARHAIMKPQYFGPKRKKVQVIVGYRETEALTAKIEPHSFRILKADCLDLPPKIYQQKLVDLTDEQTRMYRDLRKKATTQIEEGGPHVTATEVIVQMTRLHQLICGHIVDEDGKTHDIPSNRIKSLLEIIEEANGKAIIWSMYRHDIVKIVEALTEKYGPRSVVQYHGGVSDKDRTISRDRFQQDPDCRFFVGNAQTAGRGLTLTAANVVIYFSNDFSLDNRTQSEDRAHRAGLKHSVTYVDLVTPNTLDMKVLKALRNKIDVSSAIMGDGFREWLI